ncbi:cytochrome P450 [Nocardia higoensis]|uniref:cytochrome P450 n=1 Tax=Nocardia higoensis TaxID=228599 RepID=UPI002B4B804B|nr:cytochrome P450 [Nocardia higoensis]
MPADTNKVALEAKIDEVIARRRREGAGEHGDLLDRMLTVADPETGTLLDETNIRNQILTFLAVGHETSAGVMAFALHYLSVHPEIAEIWTGEEIECRDRAWMHGCQ